MEKRDPKIKIKRPYRQIELKKETLFDHDNGEKKSERERKIIGLFGLEELSDCSFNVRGKVVHAHRIILALDSQVFSEILNKRDIKYPIDIHNISYRVFHDVLRTFYDYNTTYKRDQCFEYCMQYWYCTRMVDAKVDLTTCKQELKKLITEDNVLNVLGRAIALEEKDILYKCKEFISVNTKEVIQSVIFNSTPPWIVNYIFSMDDLFISELELFDAFATYYKVNGVQNISIKSEIQYFEADIKNRQLEESVKMLDVLEKIRFFAMKKPEFIAGPHKSELLTDFQKDLILNNENTKNIANFNLSSASKQRYLLVSTRRIEIFKYGREDSEQDIKKMAKNDFLFQLQLESVNKQLFYVSQPFDFNNIKWCVIVKSGTMDRQKYLQFYFKNSSGQAVDGHTMSIEFVIISTCPKRRYIFNCVKCLTRNKYTSLRSSIDEDYIKDNNTTINFRINAEKSMKSKLSRCLVNREEDEDLTEETN